MADQTAYWRSELTLVPTNRSEATIKVSPTQAPVDAEKAKGSTEWDSLPPPDRGWRAWLFLAASFLAEFIIGGFPDSFGLFEDYYKAVKSDLFAQKRGVYAANRCI
ncbi:hypothetical protein KEM55_007754, partial [Ascosphaera atra]